MVNIAGHGGGCCGIAHAYGFGYNTEQVAQLDEQISRFEEGQDGRVIEAVLTDSQLTQYSRARADEREILANWPAELAARGFRFVGRFRNSNSGNNCNVFHRHPRWQSLTDDLPFEWNAEIAEGIQPGTVARIPRTPVPAAPGTVDLNLPIEFTDGTPAILISGNNRSVNFSARAVRPTTPGYSRMNLMGVYSYNRTTGGWAGGEHNGCIRNVVAVPTVTGSTFHNVYNDGRVGAGYDTLAEAQAASPRCRTQRRRDFMSDATSSWTDVVVNGVEQQEAPAAGPDGLVIGERFIYNNTNNPNHPENGNHYVLEALTPEQVIFSRGRRLAREHCRPFDAGAEEVPRGGRWERIGRTEDVPVGTRVRAADEEYFNRHRVAHLTEGVVTDQGAREGGSSRLLWFRIEGRNEPFGAYSQRFERWIDGE